ncbi:MAG: endopeptidase La [Actinobacteria bacterium]|nr:endopeptidase La [Actinomycetota bacterium]
MTKSQHKPEKTLPLLPTRELVVFPRMVAPIFAGREKSIKALELAFAEKTPIILSSQKEPSVEDPTVDDIVRIGTMATVVQLYRLPDGTIKALVEGKERVRIDDFTSTTPHFMVHYSSMAESVEKSGERIDALARVVVREFIRYVEGNPGMPEEMAHVIGAVNGAGELGDAVAAHLLLPQSKKQELLEMDDSEKRLGAVLQILIEENAVLDLERDINQKVQEKIEATQRQIFLHEKLRVIRGELENSPEAEDESVREYYDLLEKKQLGPAGEAVRKEIKKLAAASPMSAEVSVIRNYLDNVFALPWGERAAGGGYELPVVARHLDKTHYGLKKVKERVLEFLAVGKLLGEDQPNTTLCFVGPPGVGKSSVARAIAGALERPFVRISLGGVRDEAEIRGHRRTYVGAMPGRIIDAIVKAKADNAVVLLDEIDKMDSDFRGNPAAALMEVLDPLLNKEFRDNYLELDYDLSKVLFLATANYEDGIPATLYDRLEVIHLSGYTFEEKEQIARRHLIPKIARETGLKRRDVIFSPAAIKAVIRFYTRESGVRDLERRLRKVYRKVARRYLEEKVKLPVRIAAASLEDYLGAAPFSEEKLDRRPLKGASLGLAYTSDGGEVLTIETSISTGKGELMLTGQLGDVMQESAATAWGYLLSRVETDPRFKSLFTKKAPAFDADGKWDMSARDVRLHVPEGGIPKDGPSAGIALAASMLSAITGRAIRPAVAATGEITLRGRVLRIGGLREKCLAAVRAGVRTVILPKANRPDVKELPAKVRRELEFVFVDDFSQALEHFFL